MEKEKIHLTDIQRILLGEVPGEFYIELVIRALFCYIVIIFAMRLMGSRISANLSRNELAAIAALAASTGVPLTDPSKGLLPALVAAALVVMIQRLISRKAAEDKAFEKLTQGDISTLVKDGEMQLKDMHLTRITRDRLTAHVRGEGLEHLGAVKRLYLEAGGNFTLIKEPQPGPGLTVIPEWDTDFREAQRKDDKVQACCSCGHTVEWRYTGECEKCGKNEWIKAVAV